jgi:hypothetical protein
MSENPFSHRRTLLPFLARHISASSYLEIGVKGGKTFLPVRVRKKIAVDPMFRIKPAYKKQQILKYPFNFFARYFACPSDDFFADHAARVMAENSLDLAFIDGLHTFEQSYKDIENTLPYLQPEGIMLVHDCSPLSAAAAWPAESIDAVKKINPPGFDGLWSGDVWKVVPRLLLEHPELSVFVINEDSGLAVISQQPILKLPAPKVDYSLADIQSWDYAHLENNRQQLLNLVDAQQLAGWPA